METKWIILLVITVIIYLIAFIRNLGKEGIIIIGWKRVGFFMYLLYLPATVVWMVILFILMAAVSLFGGHGYKIPDEDFTQKDGLKSW